MRLVGSSPSAVAPISSADPSGSLVGGIKGNPGPVGPVGPAGGELSRVAYFSASQIANGVLPSSGTLNSGQTYEVTHSGATGFDVVGGAIKSDAATAYLNFGPLDGHIREFSIEMFWANESQAADDVVVMIVADGPFANNYPAGYANAGAHFLIRRDYFTYQKRAAAGPGVTGKTYTYRTPMAYGTRYTIRLLWDGVNAVVVMHDGTVVPIPYDAGYASWWGAYGCVELLGAVSGTNTAYITSFNASSEVQSVDAPLPASRLLGAMQTNGTNTSTAITTSLSARLFGLSVPVPPSRRVLITGSIWMEQTVPTVRASSVLAVGCYPAGVGGYGKLTTVYSGFTPANATADEVLVANRAGNMTSYANGVLIPFSIDLTLDPAFAVGDVQDFQIKCQAGAASQWSFTDSGGAGGFSGIRRSTLMIFELPPS